MTKVSSKERPGGWQANIEYFDDYVIKTPKTKDEITKRVSEYLQSVGKLDELNQRVKNMQEDWKNGINIISKKKIPPKMIGYAEFMKDGKIKQKRVLVLQDVLNDLADNGKTKDIDNLIDKILEFIIELWKHGIHEKTGKFTYEMGLMGNEIILIDFGEITDNKETAEKQIAKKYWEKNIIKNCHKLVHESFNKKASEALTIETLNSNWNIKSKAE